MLNRYQESAHKLGSEVFLTFIADENPSDLFKMVWDTIDDFEDRFSRFKPYSELSLLNLKPGEKFESSREFVDIIQLSNDFTKSTKGAFNPLILPSLQTVGYVSSWPNLSAKSLSQLDYRARDGKLVDNILVNKNYVTIPPNTALDLGGIGKGYLLDKLDKLLPKLGVKNFLISLGGDIRCSGSDLNMEGWTVGIANVSDGKTDVDQIKLAGVKKYTSVASSGVTKRKGPGWHHIIDPKTGLSSESDVVMSSVMSTDGVTSDILAKVLLIVGSQAAEEIAKDFDIGYLLQVATPNEIRIIKNNWD